MMPTSPRLQEVRQRDVVVTRIDAAALIVAPTLLLDSDMRYVGPDPDLVHLIRVSWGVAECFGRKTDLSPTSRFQLLFCSLCIKCHEFYSLAPKHARWFLPKVDSLRAPLLRAAMSSQPIRQWLSCQAESPYV